MNDRRDDVAATKQVIGVQLAVTMVATLMGGVQSSNAAYWVFVGACVSLLPSALFVWTVFGVSLKLSPQTLAGKLFRAEFVKMLFSAVLFLAVFVLAVQVHVVALIFGYAVAHIGGALAGLGIAEVAHDESGIRLTRGGRVDGE